MRFSEWQAATAAAVFTEHGAMIMPAVRNDPDAMAAPMSVMSYRWSASASTSATAQSVSSTIVRFPGREMTTCVSTSR